MILLDAYPLVGFLVGEPVRDQVRLLLREGPVGVPTINLAEALFVAERTFGFSIDQAYEVLDPLLGTALHPLPLNLEQARRSAQLRARYYHRARRAVSLADCVLLAAAGVTDTVATRDPALLAIAAEEGIAVTALRD